MRTEDGLPDGLEIMTTDRFEILLHRVLQDMSAYELLDVPGVYEMVAKHFKEQVYALDREEKNLL